MLTRVWARVQAAADETEATFRREAFSPGLALEGECASLVCGPEGVVWTHGSRSNPFQAALLSVWVDVWRGWQEATRPGTVYASNDPYCGGSSLCDLRMLTPIFYGGRRVGLLACAGHYGDLGGRAAGGICPGATDVQQEGLRLLPTPIARDWVLDRGLSDLLSGNSRFPDALLGDLQAQVDGLQAGAERMSALFERYGAGAVAGSAAGVGARTREAMAAAVAEVAEGETLCRDRLDGDGILPHPIRLRTRVEVRQGKLQIDFGGSDPPTPGPVNCPSDAVRAACLAGVRHLFPDVPRHGAMSAWVEVKVPERSFLNAQFPQPVGGATPEVAPRIVSGIFEALSRRLHGRGQAGGGGGANLVILQGMKGGRPYLMRLSLGGGGGASGRGDGLSNGDSGTRFAVFPPLERLERSYPIRVRRYGLRTGSGGAGRYVGGMGAVFEFELLDGTGLLTLFCDRSRRGPGGLQKGARGATTQVRLWREGHWQRLPHRTKGEAICLERGDRVRVSTAGGGGYGHPYERAIRLLSRDVRAGLLTRREAALDHGVVYHTEEGTDYDSARTFRLRSYRLTAADVEGIVDEIEEMDGA